MRKAEGQYVFIIKQAKIKNYLPYMEEL
jgi:hypothetical protein